ncbi:uncharacterized protein IUM83_08183 [Phytophthora cinnamomi]|uniref:uncharacterized protein n=1 Tax=Phytophthora cinnamomi TaxID=4785 RepID=UPI003559939F|nr:hypothetical protein IUM83_08183 [Phytophthora cinnamomi]
MRAAATRSLCSGVGASDAVDVSLAFSSSTSSASGLAPPTGGTNASSAVYRLAGIATGTGGSRRRRRLPSALRAVEWIVSGGEHHAVCA